MKHSFSCGSEVKALLIILLEEYGKISFRILSKGFVYFKTVHAFRRELNSIKSRFLKNCYMFW